VSGGKDSLTLLVALRQLKNFLPVKFELKAITLTMGIGEVDLSPVRELCERIDVSYTVENCIRGTQRKKPLLRQKTGMQQSCSCSSHAWRYRDFSPKSFFFAGNVSWQERPL